MLGPGRVIKAQPGLGSGSGSGCCLLATACNCLQLSCQESELPWKDPSVHRPLTGWQLARQEQEPTRLIFLSLAFPACLGSACLPGPAPLRFSELHPSAWSTSLRAALLGTHPLPTAVHRAVPRPSLPSSPPPLGCPGPFQSNARRAISVPHSVPFSREESLRIASCSFC